MQGNKRILICSDCDLDGSGCYWLLTKVFKDYTIESLVTTVKKFRTDLSNWKLTHKIEDYEMFIVCDLDVHTDYEFIDYKNVAIIDHHKSHFENTHVYKNAGFNVKIYPSCTKLIYDTYKEKLDLTSEEKKLILLIDDYDSYELKTKLSLMLNIVYWSYTGNRLGRFIADFNDGFKGFKQTHLNMIDIWKNKFKETIDNMQLFSTSLTIDGKEYSCCSTFGDFAINEISAYIFKKQNCDIVMIINQKSQRVYLRRNKTCDADMSKFVLSISDKEAGGHEAAAGCLLCDGVMELTKTMKRIK